MIGGMEKLTVLILAISAPITALTEGASTFRRLMHNAIPVKAESCAYISILVAVSHDQIHIRYIPISTGSL